MFDLVFFTLGAGSAIAGAIYYFCYPPTVYSN